MANLLDVSQAAGAKQPEEPAISLSTDRDRLDFARLPARYRNARLPPIPQILDFVKRLNVNLRDGRGLVMIGAHDSGKTEAACAVCRAALLQTVRVLYVSAPDLVAGLATGAMFDREDRITMAEALRDKQLLVVDDLGSELGAQESSDNAILNLMRHRWNEKKSTIIVTALSEEKLAAIYGEGFVSILHRVFRRVDLAGRSEPQARGVAPVKHLSRSDSKLFNLISLQRFKENTNDELQQTFARRANSELSIDLKGEKGRSRLKRIRQHHNLPSSAAVRKNPGN